jgi:Tol biopolymer transport system component
VLSGGGGIADIAPGKIIGEYKWAPDSSRLAYHVATITYDLFSCLPDGSGTAQVSGPLVAGGGHQMMFYWSSDSSRIVYSTDEITLGVHELFAAPPSGGRVKLFSPTLLGGQVWGIYPK